MEAKFQQVNYELKAGEKCVVCDKKVEPHCCWVMIEPTTSPMTAVREYICFGCYKGGIIKAAMHAHNDRRVAESLPIK